MTDYVYKEILKPFNQCALTGIEKVICSDRINDYRINIYKDNYNQYRITIYNTKDNVVMSSILFDQFKIVKYKHTLAEYSGNNFTRQLFAYIEYKVKRKFYHSDNLTDAGLASL